DVFLKDIWPTTQEIADIQRKLVTPAMFAKRYKDVLKGDKHWQAIKVAGGQTYEWDDASTYVANPPYFDGLSMELTPVQDVVEARVLAIFGDS
ncbi:aconitate hydratase, partial [Klebsiella pneumoniae]|nr:aconitate hydratase [Klebsiella pneumoniae]